MQPPFSVAIVGATGAVGSEILRCLAERQFPLKDLRLYGSARSAGTTVDFGGQTRPIVELKPDLNLSGLDIAFFSASGAVSREYVPRFQRAGALVIDNSSAFRMDPGTPLVVPEVNAASAFTHTGVIANPNCSTIIAAVPLWPLHQLSPIQRLIVSTYQAASGAGAKGMRELEDATRAYLNGQPYQPQVFPHSYAFNLFSHNSALNPDNGYNEEEMKLVNETRKIFGAPRIAINATCVRVPVLRAHSESITVEFERPVSPAEAAAALAKAPGVRVVDDRAANHFPMPSEASGQGDILVGRLRSDLSDPSGRSLSMFVAGDQLLKGAALNAVQIAELFL